MGSMLNKCSKCKLPKPVEEFHRGTRRCKECAKIHIAHYRKLYKGSAEGRLKIILSTACRRAKRNGLCFELDWDWLLSLFKSQNGCCKLTGIQFEYKSNGDGSTTPFSPSLDRINCEQGYTKTNTRLVCTAINNALNHYGEDIFKTIATAYLKNS